MSFPPFVRSTGSAVGVPLTLGLVITLFALLFLQNQVFLTTAELSAYDFQFQSRGPLPVPSDIVVVGVDETSISELPPHAQPVARKWYGAALSLICRAHPKAVGFDFLYESPSAYGPADDKPFAQAMKACPRAVLAESFEGADQSQYLAVERNLKAPTPYLARAATAVGVANVPTDIDNTLRGIDPVLTGPGGLNGKLYPSLAVQMLAIAEHKQWQQVAAGMPQHLLLNYLGPQDPLNPQQYSLVPVQFEGVAKEQDSPNVFRNKIVLVIPAALAYKDQFNTPFGNMYGGIVQATAVETMLHHDPITPAGDGANNIILLAIGLIASLAASRFGIYRSAAATLILAAGYAYLTHSLFVQQRLWVNLITPEVTLVLVFAAIMSVRFATEERKRRKTSRIFGQYVKPEIVEILVNSSDEEMALAGGRRPITVLFVDIRGFTAMSEMMEPEQVVSALDVYLEELTAAVQVFDGTLDKYVGDELMAIWNAPRYQKNHSLLAVQTGLDMVARMEQINEVLSGRGLPSITYGIGVNSGDAVVGNMGSSFRKQYDVIGDTVNTAARLCSAAGGGEIIIGEGTYELLGDLLDVEETEPLKLKGKNKPFRTFRVIGLRETPLAVPASTATTV